MKINIFKDNKLEINLPKFVDSRALICANSGGFNNSISRLNTLGLIQRTNGMIKLNPELLEIECE